VRAAAAVLLLLASTAAAQELVVPGAEWTDPLTPNYEGWVSAGYQVTNRAEEVDWKTYTVRVDVLARLRVVAQEKWQPRFRARLQFGGYSTEAVQLDQPETFNQLSFEASVSERLFPGGEVGLRVGVAGMFSKQEGVTAQEEGPAWWSVDAALRSADERDYVRFGLGQDQRLTGAWRRSANANLDALWQLHEEGRVRVGLTVSFQRSLYKHGGFSVQAGILALASKKSK